MVDLPQRSKSIEHHLRFYHNLIIHEVDRAPSVDEDDDGLLLKKPFDLYFMRVYVEMVAAKVWLRQRDEGATACTTVAEESSGGMEICCWSPRKLAAKDHRWLRSRRMAVRDYC
ncbi:hypothetical protein BHM03_00059817 [Ensete ventricosum]|nr:hypothetical protein BHM03_00059817 [Ensete ventricosum]